MDLHHECASERRADHKRQAARFLEKSALTLSARLYQKAGKKSEYIRQAGFAPIQQEQMVLNYIDKHGGIKRADVMDLCHLNGPQAYRLLKKLTDKGLIKKTGEKKHAAYTR